MKPPKIILGIETSCDETSVAILKRENNRIIILSNIIGSSAPMQAKYGGIIPEKAAREQVKTIIPVIKESLEIANVTWDNIDAIAVTYGPGLIGSLLVGVETAKTLAYIYKKPLVPVNHLIGHFYANWIDMANSKWQMADSKNSSLLAISHQPTFPSIGLLVSGGHTDLVLFKDHGEYVYLGGTRDDAAGECFDKCARLLGFPYPGGPKISKLAESGDPKKFKLPQPMINSKDFDFSFSGLKTAFSLLVEKHFEIKSRQSSVISHQNNSWPEIISQDNPENQKVLADMCASLEASIINVLVRKTVKAVEKYQVKQVIVAGGVAANQRLRQELELRIKNQGLKTKINFPEPILCTDNGAMIASSAFFSKETISPLDLQANPNLSL